MGKIEKELVNLNSHHSAVKKTKHKKLFSYKSEEHIFNNKELNNYEINEHFNNERQEINKNLKRKVILTKLNKNYKQIMTKNLNRNKPFKCYKPPKKNYMQTYNKQLQLINRINTCKIKS